MYIDRHHVASNCLGRIDQILEKNAGIRKQEDINRLNRVMNVLYDINIFMENVCSAMTDIICIDPKVVCKAVGASDGKYKNVAKEVIKQGAQKIEKYIDSPIYEEIAQHEKEASDLRRRIIAEKAEHAEQVDQIFIAKMTRGGGMSPEQAESRLKSIKDNPPRGLQDPTANAILKHAADGPSCFA